MKNFKRLFVLVLAVAMCLTAFAISSSAAGEFNPTVDLLARYNETGDKIIVTVTTSKACGAIMGTLKYPAGSVVDVKLADSKFVEDVETEDNTNYYSEVTNGVKFAVVTDNVTVGSKTWVDVYFDVKDIEDEMSGDAALKFTFEEIQVCSVGEELADGVVAEDVKVEIPYVSLRALGAKKQADANTILFGSRVDLIGSTEDAKAATNIVVKGVEYKATSCGYAYAYTTNVSANNFAGFGAQLDAEGNVVARNTSNTLVHNCKYYKYWNEIEGYFVYTLKISNIKAANSAKEIAVKPYVVYEDNDGNKLLIEGNVISRSCDGIASAPAFLGNGSETTLW